MTEATDTRKRERAAYSIDVAADICDRIVQGMHAKEICDGCEGRPAWASTMFLWLSEHPEFEVMYRRAWEWRVESMCMEIVQIADDDENDTIVSQTAEGNEKATQNTVNIARSKLRIETRWRTLAAQFPRKYGGSTLGGAVIKISGGDDAKLIEQTPQDEAKQLTSDALYEDALAFAPKDKA